MFSNYPLTIQILGWGMFMGLNGYIGSSCPGLNLAVLAFAGMFASRKVGVLLLIAAIIITLAESFWFMLNGFAAGMSTIPQKMPSFLAQGSGILNLLLAGIVFFVLLGHFQISLAAPKGVILAVLILFYAAGAWAGVSYWIPLYGHICVLVATGALVTLCSAGSASFGLVISGLIFLGLFSIWGVNGYKNIRDYQNRRADDKSAAEFLQATADNQQAQLLALWDQVDLQTKEQALEKALEAQNAEMVSFLIKQGVIGSNAMDEALYNQDLATIQFLVAAGRKVQPGDIDRAAELNFLPAVKLFVEQGVDLNTEYHRPLTTAGKAGHTEVLEFLLKTGKNSQETLNEALTEVFWGFAEDKEKIVHLLLNNGAGANGSAGYFRKTPLHGAVRTGNLNLVKLLISKGADVNAADKEGTTVLMEAVQEDHLEVVRFLLQHGADKTINQKYDHPNTSPNQESVLWMAKTPQMAKLLLDKGATPQGTNSHGDTVLLKAVGHRNPDLVKLFLETDVEINAKNKDGETALLAAVKDASYASEQLETVKLLLEKGADINVTDKEGKTPLMLADNLDIIQILLEHGAEVNTQDNDGKTALIYNSYNYDPEGEKVALLLKHGANVNLRDKNGKTALGYATGNLHSWFSEKRVAVLKQYDAKK